MKYTSTIKDSKEYGLVKNILYNLVLSIFIILAISVLIVYILGLKLDVVLSDSMNPVFYKNDIVVVRPCAEYNEGDIIEYQLGYSSIPVTHRIVEKIGSGKSAVFITKGDANTPTDGEIPYSCVKGKVVAIIENGNFMYEFVKNNYFLLLNILLGFWVLTATLVGELEISKHNIAKV